MRLHYFRSQTPCSPRDCDEENGCESRESFMLAPAVSELLPPPYVILSIILNISIYDVDEIKWIQTVIDIRQREITSCELFGRRQQVVVWLGTCRGDVWLIEQQITKLVRPSCNEKRRFLKYGPGYTRDNIKMYRFFFCFLFLINYTHFLAVCICLHVNWYNNDSKIMRTIIDFKTFRCYWELSISRNAKTVKNKFAKLLYWR